MKYTIELTSRELSSLCIACTIIRRSNIDEAENPETNADRREICTRTAEFWTSLRANLREQREAANKNEETAEQELETPEAPEAPAQEAQDTAEIMQQAGAVELPQRVALYVPGTQGPATATDNAAQVERVAAEFSRWFGGATAQESAGFWMSDTAGLVREAVTIVYAACTAEQLEKHLAAVVELAQQIKREMRQEAVSAEIDGTLYII